MVPRWRPAAQTLAHGEFVPIHNAPEVSAPDPEVALAALVDDWKQQPAYGYAADLVSAASVFDLPNAHEDVRSAARFVLESGDVGGRDAIRRLAARILGHEAITEGEVEAQENSAGARLRQRRGATRRYPFDPLLWVDLARDHASLGHRRSADRAMRVALGLAPQNRFVLRSFTRLALHLSEDERYETLPLEAWERLRRSGLIRSDPWLIAAEIATAMVVGRTPKAVRDGRTLLDSGRFSPFELSELAAALGSLEIDAGAVRPGRRLLGRAVISPTDNAVAQVAWTARNRDISLLDPRHLELDLTFEARAWECHRNQHWQAALVEAEKWHEDEPFAGRPLQLATFVSAVPLADFSRAADLARVGLSVNPDDQILRNNLAFALASAGKWLEAERILLDLRPSKVRRDMVIEYAATWGLIFFRAGSIADGQRLYDAAIARARHERRPEREALAMLYLAREERLARTERAVEVLARARELVQTTAQPHLVKVLAQVEATQSDPAESRSIGAPAKQPINLPPIL